MTEKLKVGPSPHILDSRSVSSIMWDVVIALIPVTAAAIIHFGLNAVFILLVSTLSRHDL